MRTYTQVMLALLPVVGVAATALAAPPVAKDIPAHPNELVYPPLDYQVPPAAQFREVLPNGLVVYIAEDRMLPTFDLTVTIRTGGAFAPPEKAGLAALTGEQLRDGGAESLTPEEMDERIEFLAASLSSRITDTRGTANLWVLSKDIDQGLELLIDVLRRPGLTNNGSSWPRSAGSRTSSAATTPPRPSRASSGDF